MWLCVFVLAAFTAVCRLPYLAWHFTHIDDVGVAETLLRSADPVRADAFFQQKIQEAHDRKGTPRAVFLTCLADSSAWATVRSTMARTYRFVSVPAEWTYAPAQFLLTTFLIHPDDGYRQTLFLGRLPSALAAVAGVVLLFLLVWSREVRQGGGAAFLASVLMACSMENLVFSMQMSNYALGPVAVVMLLFLLWRNIERPAFSARGALLNGSALAALFLCHYQVLPLVFAFLVVVHVTNAPNRGGVFSLRNIAASALTSVPFVVAFIPVVLLRFSDLSPLNWNMGPNGEFAFGLPAGVSAWSQIVYAVSFLLRNGMLVVWSVTSFLPEYSWASRPVGIMLCGLAFLGLIRLFRSASKCDRSTASFIVLSLVLWIGLVIARRLTLSPTRHSLVLLPFLALLITQGVVQLAHWMRGGAISLIATALVVMALFAANLPGFMATRLDLFDEVQVYELCHEYGVGQVATTFGAGYNLKLMRSLKSMMVTEFTPRFGANLSSNAVLVAARQDPHYGPLRSECLFDGIPESLAAQLRGRKVLTLREYPTGSETEFSARTRNGRNSLILAVFGPLVPDD